MFARVSKCVNRCLASNDLMLSSSSFWLTDGKNCTLSRRIQAFWQAESWCEHTAYWYISYKLQSAGNVIHIPDPFLTRFVFWDDMCLAVTICSQKIHEKNLRKKSSSFFLSYCEYWILEFNAFAVKDEFKNIIVAFGLVLFAFTQRSNTGLYDPYM